MLSSKRSQTPQLGKPLYISTLIIKAPVLLPSTVPSLILKPLCWGGGSESDSSPDWIPEGELLPLQLSSVIKKEVRTLHFNSWVWIRLRSGSIITFDLQCELQKQVVCPFLPHRYHDATFACTPHNDWISALLKEMNIQTKTAEQEKKEEAPSFQTYVVKFFIVYFIRM